MRHRTRSQRSSWPITPGLPSWPGYRQEPVDTQPRRTHGAGERRVRRVRPPRPARLRPPRRRRRRRGPDPHARPVRRDRHRLSARPSPACAASATPGPRSAPGSASAARPPQQRWGRTS